MVAVAAFLALSPSIIIGEKIPELAGELEIILPESKDIVVKFKDVKIKFCKPLLLTDPEELEEYLLKTLPFYALHIAFAMEPISSNLFLRVEEEEIKNRLKKMMNFEKKFFDKLTVLLKEKASSYSLKPDSIIRAHAAAIDYDLWLINSVLEIGLTGFLKRISERAIKEFEEFTNHLYLLFYVTMGIDMVLLEDSPYREDTLIMLVNLSSDYAEEVEDYLDTLSLLISNETYEALTDFMNE